MSAVKVGLALGGGALRGMAHVGVLQVMEENGIPINLIVGTSMGALIGGIYASGVKAKMLERIAEQLNMRDFYDVVMPREGLVLGDRLLTLFRTMTGNRDISQASIPYASIATDIETGDMVVMNEGKICDAIRASISLPGIFVPYTVNGRKLCDGGLVDRVPVTTVRDMGADVVIAVDVGYKKGYVDRADGILLYLLRAFDIMDWELAQLRMNTADVLIAPDLKNIDYTSLRDAEEAIQLGRAECEKALPQIRAAMEKAGTRQAEEGKSNVHTG